MNNEPGALLAAAIRTIVPAYLDAEAERIRLLTAGGHAEAAQRVTTERDELMDMIAELWQGAVGAPLDMTHALSGASRIG